VLRAICQADSTNRAALWTSAAASRRATMIARQMIPAWNPALAETRKIRKSFKLFAVIFCLDWQLLRNFHPDLSFFQMIVASTISR
jgi:hypothetical protein